MKYNLFIVIAITLFFNHLHSCEFLEEPGIFTSCTHSSLACCELKRIAWGSDGIDLVRNHLDKGGDVKVKDHKNRNLLQLLIYGMKNSELDEKANSVINELLNGTCLDHEDDNGHTVFYFSSSMGNSDLLSLFLNQLPDNQKLTIVNKVDIYGSTAMHIASSKGHYECVKLLTENGAEVDIQDRNGMTALHLSCLFGHFSLAEYLLSKNANVLRCCYKGMNAIDYFELWQTKDSIIKKTFKNKLLLEHMLAQNALQVEKINFKRNLLTNNNVNKFYRDFNRKLTSLLFSYCLHETERFVAPKSFFAFSNICNGIASVAPTPVLQIPIQLVSFFFSYLEDEKFQKDNNDISKLWGSWDEIQALVDSCSLKICAEKKEYLRNTDTNKINEIAEKYIKYFIDGLTKCDNKHRSEDIADHMWQILREYEVP